MSASSTASGHYDAAYFAAQKATGEFGAWADRPKFAEFFRGDEVALDFGCGTGWMLAGLPCRERIGVDINPVALEAAGQVLDRVYRSVKELASGSVDLVISDNALEHTTHPLDELRELHRVMRSGGRIVVVVPCETWRKSYQPEDMNRHLFSWSPMCLGNLLTEAGFDVQWSKPYIHKWPPHHYRQAARYGRTVFDLVCKTYARLTPDWHQTRAFAIKR